MRSHAQNPSERFDDLQQRPPTGVPFGDLPAVGRLAVLHEWQRLIAKWSKWGRLPSWRRGLLAANARNRILHPLTPTKARSMRGRKAALAKHRLARLRGIDVLAAARRALAAKRARERERREVTRPVHIAPCRPTFLEVLPAPPRPTTLSSPELEARKRLFDHVYKFGAEES